MVMFHHEIPYHTALERGAVQAQLVTELTVSASTLQEVDFDRARREVYLEACAFRLSDPFERDEAVRIRILVIHIVMLTPSLTPLAAAPTGELRVAIVDSGVHHGKMDAGCLRQASPINFRAADDHQFTPRPRSDTCGVESVDNHAIARRKAVRAAQHYIDPARQSLADRLIRPAPHENGLPQCKRFKMTQIRRQMPWQPAAAADDIVLRHGDH